MGMIMHDDVPYGEGTSYTQGTGIAINNNIIAVDADNTPTKNSEKPVKSKGVYSAVESSREESTTLLKSTVGWTGKNDLPELTNLTTESDVTFTKNSDKSVSTSGTATARIQKEYASHANTGGLEKFIGKEVILNGCPNGGSNTTYRLNAWFYDGTNQLNYNDVGSGVKFTFPDIINTYTQWNIKLDINAGGTTVDVSDKTFKGMLRDASITDDTYEPYHESVEEEIEQIYADNGVLGAKNLIDVRNNFTTINGVTITRQSDNSYIINGTCTAAGTNIRIDQSIYNGVDNLKSYNGRYTLTLLDANGNYVADMRLFVMQNSTFTNALEANASNLGKATGNIQLDNCFICIGVQNGKTYNNVRVYPMIRLASDPDDTYVPYAMTNRELTENVNIMLPIDFSGATELTANTNLNNLGVGIAKCSNRNSSTIVNKPNGIDGAFDIITMNTWDSNYKRQIYMLRDSNGILTRICNNGSWGNWYSISMTVIS